MRACQACAAAVGGTQRHEFPSVLHADGFYQGFVNIFYEMTFHEFTKSRFVLQRHEYKVQYRQLILENAHSMTIAFIHRILQPKKITDAILK